MAVANLPAQNATTVVALESVATAALVAALFRFLIRIVTAIVDTVAAALGVDADMIVTLKPFWWTVFSFCNKRTKKDIEID